MVVTGVRSSVSSPPTQGHVSPPCPDISTTPGGNLATSSTSGAAGGTRTISRWAGNIWNSAERRSATRGITASWQVCDSVMGLGTGMFKYAKNSTQTLCTVHMQQIWKFMVVTIFDGYRHNRLAHDIVQFPLSCCIFFLFFFTVFSRNHYTKI